MSAPRNHHFVSKIHIKQFFNSSEKKIYLYDKKLNNHYFKLTAKSVFSETDLNTRYIDGYKDFRSLENELNQYFEKDFHGNLQILNEFIKNNDRSTQVDNALFYFARYGVIGDLRTPRHKTFLDNSLYKAMSEIMPHCESKLKAELEEMFAYKKEVKYSNVVGYAEIVNKILELMGGLAFAINIPKNDSDYFILPDCSGLTVRAKINEYFNPDIQEIAYIGLPLTSKIYLHFFSEKLFKEKPISKIVAVDSKEIQRLNLESINFCDSKVACENEFYLKKLIKK